MGRALQRIRDCGSTVLCVLSIMESYGDVVASFHDVFVCGAVCGGVVEGLEEHAAGEEGAEQAGQSSCCYPLAIQFSKAATKIVWIIENL